MRTYNFEESAELGAEQWQIDLVKANPDYTCWGPHEDYMATRGQGWSDSQVFHSWNAFGPWGLDDLNECVNFYFSVLPGPSLCLTLWMLHPRKGCSRGVEISRVEPSEIPSILSWLKIAADRNASRFSKLNQIHL